MPTFVILSAGSGKYLVYELLQSMIPQKLEPSYSSYRVIDVKQRFWFEA